MSQEATAKLRYLRMSPRKVRLVIDVIRNMEVAPAKAQLSFMKKAAARPILKLLNSAVANATHNLQMSSDHLFIKSIMADKASTMKRSMPRAFGRAAVIRKHSTHVIITLGEKTPVTVAAKK